jgi:hypothetical protein
MHGECITLAHISASQMGYRQFRFAAAERLCKRHRVKCAHEVIQYRWIILERLLKC